MAFSRLGTVALTLAFLFTGTLTSLSSKMFFETKGPLEDGTQKFFQKPWYQVWFMFLGMAMVGPIQFLYRCVQRAQGRELSNLGNSRKSIALISVPAFCDLLATFCQNFALVYTPVSIWQMLRGSICVFCAMQRYFYFKEKPKCHQTVGIALVVLGLCIDGIASILTPSSSDGGADTSTGMKCVGIAFVLVAQFIQAWQTVVEEKLLHGVECDALYVVFLEGAWGLLFTTVIFMPLAQALPGNDGAGVHEDIWPEEFYMVGHSASLVGITCVYVVVIMLYNVFGMVICDETEATTRNVIDAVRTLCVWLLAVVLQFIDPTYGEKLGWWSIFELLGFAVLTLGLFVYYDVISLPCVPREVEEDLTARLEGRMAHSPVASRAELYRGKGNDDIHMVHELSNPNLPNPHGV